MKYAFLATIGSRLGNLVFDMVVNFVTICLDEGWDGLVNRVNCAAKEIEEKNKKKKSEPIKMGFM